MKIGIMKTEIRIKPQTGCFCGFWIQKAVPWEGERIYKLLYKKTKELEYLWKDPQVDNWDDFYKAVLYFYMTKEILSENPEIQVEYERIKTETAVSMKKAFGKKIGQYKADYRFISWYEDYLREQADPSILEREKRQREVDEYIARTRYQREQAERSPSGSLPVL